MDAQILIPLLTGLGIGSIATSIISGWLDKKKQMDLTLARILEDKYRGLLVFMACALDIEKKRFFTISEQVEQKTSKDYMNQVIEYYYHSTLYSSDQVILSLKDFINSPSQESYIKVAQAMRKDLWGRKTSIDFNDIKLEKADAHETR
jgi:acyl-CoA hydrolase